MCGRFVRKTPTQDLATLFDAVAAADLPPSYNVAPTQAVAVVRPAAATPGRELVAMRWGLIPAWADDPAIGNRMINARSDTVATKPSFRSAFKVRRCLVVTDGFYEWQKLDAKHKQPFCIRRQDGQPFAFAGLWERWTKGEEPVESCTIITTDANDLMKPIHDRMPVILMPNDYASWLDPKTGKEEAQQLLRPLPAGELAAFPVGTFVNSPRNNDPMCIQPEQA